VRQLAFVQPTLYQKTAGIFAYKIKCPKCEIEIEELDFTDPLVICPDCGESIYLLERGEI